MCNHPLAFTDSLWFIGAIVPKPKTQKCQKFAFHSTLILKFPSWFAFIQLRFTKPLAMEKVDSLYNGRNRPLEGQPSGRTLMRYWPASFSFFHVFQWCKIAMHLANFTVKAEIRSKFTNKSKQVSAMHPVTVTTSVFPLHFLSTYCNLHLTYRYQIQIRTQGWIWISLSLRFESDRRLVDDRATSHSWSAEADGFAEWETALSEPVRQ